MTREQKRTNIERIARIETSDSIKRIIQHYERMINNILDDDLLLSLDGNNYHASIEFYQEIIQQHREALSLRIEKESINV